MSREDEEERIRANGLQAMRNADWKLIGELATFKAKMAHVRYQALRKEGFNMVEALALCTKEVEL